MSEEEKKAIEIIKQEITKPETTPLEVYVTDIKMLLHIIDKQQEEIEKIKQEMEERLIGREEITKYEIGYEIDKNYISKDKIRDKIKELEEIGQMLAAEQGYWGNPKLLNQMEILKELLGE